MAEYKAFGPGFSDSGRDSTNASIVLDRQEYKRYDSLKKVFQTPEGKFGNVGWIDRNVD